jgi:hypothetical protein
MLRSDAGSGKAHGRSLAYELIPYRHKKVKEATSVRQADKARVLQVHACGAADGGKDDQGG